MISNEGARPRISEVIVVEGVHDAQAVRRAVQADVWVLGGDRIHEKTVKELRRALTHRGVVILTDPDGPGERIRGRLSRWLPGAKHAFLPKDEAKGEGRIGVEYATPAAILRSLQSVRQREDASRNPTFSMEDLIEHQLAGGPLAAHRRAVLGEWLNLGYANAKSFLHKLNALGVTREEWESAMVRLDNRRH